MRRADGRSTVDASSRTATSPTPAAAALSSAAWSSPIARTSRRAYRRVGQRCRPRRQRSPGRSAPPSPVGLRSCPRRGSCCRGHRRSALLVEQRRSPVRAWPRARPAAGRPRSGPGVGSLSPAMRGRPVFHQVRAVVSHPRGRLSSQRVRRASPSPARRPAVARTQRCRRRRRRAPRRAREPS